MELEGYSALSKALKEFPKLRHLHIEDLPLHKYEMVLNMEGICNVHKHLMILDLKLYIRKISLPFRPSISENAYTFTNGIKKLHNLNELKWVSKVLPTGFLDALTGLKHLYSLKLQLVENFSDVVSIVNSVKGLVELHITFPE